MRCRGEGIDYQLAEYNCRHIVVELWWKISARQPPSHCQHGSLLSEGGGSSVAFDHIEETMPKGSILRVEGRGLRHTVKKGLSNILNAS